jgi:SAM-dependent methyltransferase
MDYSSQKQFFQRAYATGSDDWTNLPFHKQSDEFMKALPAGAMVLDLGSGRGHFPYELVRNGFKVIGLDYLKELTTKNNLEVKNLGFERKLRFLEGDVFDIPLTDASFDAVADIGLLHHVHPEDWSEYRNEVLRILKPGGLFYLITLSKDTASFFTWAPLHARFGDFNREGVYYHFFTAEELLLLFGSDFDSVSQSVQSSDAHGDRVRYFVTIFKKR